ncbi:MAG TPA: enoyl-CoA hydratase/isomerase family protein [Kineosporiaceae bacterium]|nr:enoyl-CoA hydratase/isomerase family protein [Kineosporiaceae bacterium]
MPDSAAVTVNRQDALAVVSVGPGDRTNALGTEDWLRLAAVMRELATDDELRAVVVTGRDGSSFSAGSQVSEWIGAEEADVERSFAAMEEALTAVEDLPVPAIAQVRGAALGAGCQLACACDLRVIGRHARIGMPIARWGILAPPTFAARIALLTGPGVARDLLLTGRLLGGEEALRLGLASACVAESRLEGETRSLVQAITAHPARAVRAAKRAVDTVVSAERERLRSLPPTPSVDLPSLRTGLATLLPPAAREPS